MELLALIGAWIVVILIGALGAAIVIQIYRGRIDMSKLLQGKDGKASFSRFQFLVFTFVIAMCLLILTIESGEFPKIDANILGLLGISGGSYVVSKGISESKSKPNGDSSDDKERKG